MGKFGHFGGDLHRLRRSEAGFALLRADVDLQQDGLDHVHFFRRFLDALQKLRPIDRFDQIDLPDDLPDLVGLQIPDEMDGPSGIGALGQLLHQLLHAVFTAAVHARRHRLAHGFGIVHFCRGAKKDLLRRTARALRGLRHVFADRSDIFCNVRHTYPTTFPS